MKRIIVSICVLLVLSTAAFGQTRSRTTRRGTQTSKTAKPAPADAAAQVRIDGATKVAEQIKNLTRLLYIFGGMARGSENVDLPAENNQASTAALPTNDQYKAVMKTS